MGDSMRLSRSGVQEKKCLLTFCEKCPLLVNHLERIDLLPV